MKLYGELLGEGLPIRFLESRPCHLPYSVTPLIPELQVKF